MKKARGSLVSFLPFMVLLAGGLASCVQGTTTLQITGILMPSSPATAMTGCTYTGGAMVTRRLIPVLDSFRATSSENLADFPAVTYQAVLNVVSYLPTRASRQFPLQVDPNALQLSEAEVTLSDVRGQLLSFGSLQNPFRIPIAQFFRSSEGSGGSYEAVIVPVVPAAYGARAPFVKQPEALDAPSLSTTTVMVTVVLRGATQGGTGIESMPYTFPLQVCDRCLVSCQLLPATTGTPDFAPVYPCLSGQDDFYAGVRSAEDRRLVCSR